MSLLLLGIVPLCCAFHVRAIQDQENVGSQEHIKTEIPQSGNVSTDLDINEGADDEIMRVTTERSIDAESDTVTKIEQSGEMVRGSRELLEYLFDYLYDDAQRTSMIELELCETEDELYYRWKNQYDDGDVSDPRVLEYRLSTPDGLYQEFAAYGECWPEWHDEEGAKHREHTRNSYGDRWLVNRDTKEVIPWRFYNEDSEDDTDYFTDNEKFYEILRYYADDYKEK